ncbi:hypothetical protein CK203_049256 [Vitis vinifera]|uniref:Uncharacterized protein n=1 Tax=Vitis vinifera TaxID=29760 RepID=A0A438GKU6_VITVI|nr:hypothetical protein CK203_063347 [Vitis vinifera]RVW63331.1 hypothetical protein CK203_058242 [Vitis vinifera]RVW72839.1 hypothetical protein CK203_049256 [Vitis vinifera]
MRNPGFPFRLEKEAAWEPTITPEESRICTQRAADGRWARAEECGGWQEATAGLLRKTEKGEKRRGKEGKKREERRGLLADLAVEGKLISDPIPFYLSLGCLSHIFGSCFNPVFPPVREPSDFKLEMLTPAPFILANGEPRMQFWEHEALPRCSRESHAPRVPREEVAADSPSSSPPLEGALPSPPAVGT